MGCSLFSYFHFQMGVTVMGFAEHFGKDVEKKKKELKKSLEHSIVAMSGVNSTRLSMRCSGHHRAL